MFDEAITARVLAEAPTVGRLRFSHTLVRDTLYEALTAGQRRAAHLRAGEILERLYASDPEPHLAELAYHFFEALPSGDIGRAVDYAQRAGDHAVALLAYEEAARLTRSLCARWTSRRKRLRRNEPRYWFRWVTRGHEPGTSQQHERRFSRQRRSRRAPDLPVLQAQAALGYGGRLVWSRAYDDVHLIPLLEGALQALPPKPSPLRVR